MRRLIRAATLAGVVCASAAQGISQDSRPTTPNASDREAQKQAERDRKEAERRRKEGEKAEQQQQQQPGVRCARLRKKG